MDSSEEIEILKRALKREKAARKQAEQILEDKSLQLYESNKKLQELNEDLETQIENRVSELREREAQLVHLFENNPFPMLIYDYETLKIVDMNAPAKLFYGEVENIIGKLVTDLHPEEEKSEAIATQQKVLKGEPIIFREWSHRTHGDIYRPVELHSSEINFHGRVSRLLLINDITERKQIEREKELNQRKYQILVESASDIIFRSTMDGDFVYVNPTAIHLTEFTEKELLTMSYLDLIHPDYLQSVKDFYEKQKEDGERSSYLEFPIITKSGRVVWVGQNVNLLVNDQGEPEANALARNITELKLARESLERSENKYRNILENLKLGILEVNLDGKITNAYPKFEELTGYSKAELIGQSPIDFLLPKEHRAVITRQNVLRAQGKGSVYEVEIITKSGEKKWVIISGAPFYDRSGKISGTVGIHLDISERKRIERELLEAKEVAEKSVHIKEMFMANMSHEIRTPMNAILGMSRLLERTSLEPKQQEYVRALNFSAENLLIIINDILDFSKIEIGDLDLAPANENLTKLCSDIVSVMIPKADEKDNVLKLTQEGFNHDWYQFDKTRLNQVLTNLIGNAIKFTNNGEIKLNIKNLGRSGKGDLIRFEVIDSGIGISAENQSKIFESFIQEDNTIEKEYGGTGLGLPISQRIVKKMGGELLVDSKKGEGANFFFIVEFPKGESTEETIPEIVEDENLRGLKVLLVEDNEINLFMAQTILEELGCVVEIAKNGLQAVDSVSKTNFDAVLMDMRMPVMNGIDATREIRNTLKVTDLPIIALTANTLDEDKENCLSAGMNEFLTKPFERDQLLTVLSPYVNETNPSKQSTMINLVDSSNLDKVAGGNEGFKKQMTSLFLAESEKELGYIREAKEKSEWKTISEIAHKLKPSLDYLAVSELRELVREIESSFSDGSAPSNFNKLDEFLLKVERLRGQLSE